MHLFNLFEFEFSDSSGEESRAHVVASTLYEALTYFYSHFPDTEPDRVSALGSVILSLKGPSE